MSVHDPHDMVGGMLNLRRLKYFAAVAQHGSMAAAARTLNVAQPALSHHVSELERMTGFRLFERLPRGVKLTEGGHLLLDHAQIILEQVAEAERAIRAHLKPDAARATLRLGLLPSWSIAYGAEIRRAIKGSYPDLSTLVIDLRHDEAVRMVANEEVDLAIMLQPGSDPELAEPLAREPLYVISATPLPQAVTLARLATLTLILTTRRHPDRQALERVMRKNGMKMDVALEVDGQKTLIKAVAQGLGTAVVGASAAKNETASGVLHAAPIIEPGITRSIYLAKATGTSLGLALTVHKLIGSIALRGAVAAR